MNFEKVWIYFNQSLHVAMKNKIVDSHQLGCVRLDCQGGQFLMIMGEQVYVWSFKGEMLAILNFLKSVNFIDQMVCRPEIKLQLSVNIKASAECQSCCISMKLYPN